MSLSIGIVGLPNVGKSTLFNALTDNDVLAANYPFATIEPNTGVVPIPDERLNKLAEIYKSKKVIPATVNFVDIAGLVSGANQGEGLGNQFLSHIRSCSAICQVIRAFNDSNVGHVEQKHDPKKDIEIINTELVLADLQTVEKRLPKLQKETKANPKLKPLLAILEEAKKILDEGEPLSSQSEEWRKSAQELIGDLQLLTIKPVIYLFNVDEQTLTDETKKSELAKLAAPAKSLFVCAKLEDELKGLESHEALELLESYGVNERGLDKVIHATYDILGLQSFLTAGEKEVRAWTIKRGFSAPQAAGVIHSDFEKGFIAAQIIDFDDLMSHGSEQAAKAAGKVRTEGKDYVLGPNDIVEFRFNV